MHPNPPGGPSWERLESALHYLDYAATSAVRPASVAEAVRRCLAEVGASPGRGGHSASLEAGRIALRARRSVARVLGFPGDPGRLVFMLNATHALNTALYGTLRSGDAVVFTAYDHNSVLRPVYDLVRSRGVDARMVSGAPDGSLDLEEVSRLLEGARVLVVNAASNVLGTRLPLAQLSAQARSHGALTLVDAAQSAGHLAGSPAEDGADVVAFTGHKGLLGPQGIGGLWIREGVDVVPVLRGGTGGNSVLRDMPDALPDRLEAGTQNTPGMAGLLAGCEHLLQEGVEEIHGREMHLKGLLRDGMEGIPGVTVHSPPAPDGVGIVTITARGWDPGALSHRLEREWGVCARVGLHCAPEVHRILGTQESGALRFSLGWASSEADVTAAVEGVDALVRPRMVSLGGS